MVTTRGPIEALIAVVTVVLLLGLLGTGSGLPGVIVAFVVAFVVAAPFLALGAIGTLIASGRARARHARRGDHEALRRHGGRLLLAASVLLMCVPVLISMFWIMTCVATGSGCPMLN